MITILLIISILLLIVISFVLGVALSYFNLQKQNDELSRENDILRSKVNKK